MNNNLEIILSKLFVGKKIGRSKVHEIVVFDEFIGFYTLGTDAYCCTFNFSPDEDYPNDIKKIQKYLFNDKKLLRILLMA